MTDEQIIKALECYIKENEFEYFHSNTMNEYPLIRKALDLINRLKVEIESLKDKLNHSMGIDNTKENGYFPFD